MLIDPKNSRLLVIDIQQRLVETIHDHQTIIANCAWLIKVAFRLDVPVLASEQYPRGLGHTVTALRNLLPDSAFMEKVCFSCTGEPVCMEQINAWQQDQVILIGIEAHVCVLQTALGLLNTGKDVYVVADCISSRHPHNVELAIERMRAEGVRIVSREMVVFEWLQRSATNQFREISRDFLKPSP